MITMDIKQKEALVIAMLEKGESYRSIAQKAKVSPNTIKMLANRAGLDETTSISSRAFELYSQQKNPLEVAMALDLKAEDAIKYHQEYIMLLGLTEFTKIYIQIKDNPWPYVNLVKLTQNSRIKDGEVVELLKIANGYLPRVRLEYDRVKEELNSRKAELISLKAETRNEVRTYQQFCDRNLELKKREDELQHGINELEAKKTELQETTTDSNQHVAEFQETNADLEMEQEIVMLMNDLSTPPQNIANSYHQNERNISLSFPS
jgi:hypothetical protein